MAKTNGVVKDEEEISKIDVTLNQRNAAAYKRASFHPPDEIWNIFTEAEDCCDIIGYFKVLVKSLNIDSSLHGREFYDILKSKLTTWKCQSLWDLLNLKLKQSEYEQGSVGKGTQCLIIGAGPIGLRTAIEMLALGCKTVVLEKRTEFTRNNVLHLWPFLLTDFRSLGAKKFYGKFGSGSIDHINIKTLQCILLKVALVLGVEIHVGVAFKHLIEPTDEISGWKASLEPENHILSKYVFNVCIGADGKKNVLPGFPQIELRGALAIGITCNFVNHNTIEEAKVSEISGVSCQFNPNFFKNMEEQYGVKLENIVYYKNETHYFVMTALKASLLNHGVIIQDFSDPKRLLDPSNICSEKLVEYTLCAVNFATNHQLPDLEFKKLSNGKSDIALFDFTSIKKAANAARIVERKKQKLLLALVGDSLMEPFWPTGSGCGRGVLSALDVAWTVCQFAKNVPPLIILRDRENVFKLLSGVTNDQLQKNYNAFTINPLTRYSAFDAKKIKNLNTLKKLYDTDDVQNADLTASSPHSPRSPKKIFRNQRSGDNVSPPKLGNQAHQNKQLKSKRKSDRAELKDQALVGNTKAFWEDHNKKNFEERANEQLLKKSKSISKEENKENKDDLFEDFEEIENDVSEDASPIKKKGFVRDKSTQLRKHSSSKLKGQDETKHKIFKRRSLSKTSKAKQTSNINLKENENAKQSISSKPSQVPEVSIKDKNILIESKEQPRPVSPKNFFEKWVEDFLIKKKNVDETSQSVAFSIENAAMTVMVVPLLMECNKATLRQTSGSKLKELRDSFINPNSISNEKKEIIQISRNTSVKSTVAKYKQIAEKDLSHNNYYDFLKKNRANSPDQVDASSNLLVENDFQVKEVIDVEKALLDNNNEEKKRSRLTKKPSHESFFDIESPLKMISALERLCDSQTPLSALLLLQVLYNIHKRIQMFPSEDKYYRVYTKGMIFERYVWILDGAEAFLQLLGWVKCGNYIVFSKSTSIFPIVKVIEEIFKKKKRAQIAYSGSVQGYLRKPVSVRRACSNLESFIVEDVVESHVYSEDVDSAIGSDEELGKPRLKRLQSAPHILGEEEYIVVDFIGEETSSKLMHLSEDINDTKVEESSLHELIMKNSNDSHDTKTTLFHEKKEYLVSENTSSLNKMAEDETPSTVFTDTEQNATYTIPVIVPRRSFKNAPRKKVFSAGKGLKKKLNKELLNPNLHNSYNLQLIDNGHDIKSDGYQLINNNQVINDESHQEGDNVLSTSPKANINDSKQNVGQDLNKLEDREVNNFHSSNSLKEKSFIENEKTILTPNFSRKTQNTLNSEDRSKSIVAQNKFLFDLQIANELKNKITIERPERPRSTLSLNNYNIDKSQSSNSLKKSINEEIPVAGIVSGTRALFEGGKQKNNDDRLSLRSFQEEEFKSFGTLRQSKKSLNEDQSSFAEDRHDTIKLPDQKILNQKTEFSNTNVTQKKSSKDFSISNQHFSSRSDKLEFHSPAVNKIENVSAKKNKNTKLFLRRHKNEKLNTPDIIPVNHFHDYSNENDSIEDTKKQETTKRCSGSEIKSSEELTDIRSICSTDSDISIILGEIINRESFLEKNKNKTGLGFKKKIKSKNIKTALVDAPKVNETKLDGNPVNDESRNLEKPEKPALHNMHTFSDPIDLSVGVSIDDKIQNQHYNGLLQKNVRSNILSATHSNYSLDGVLANRDNNDSSSHEDELVEMFEEASKHTLSGSTNVLNDPHSFESSHERKKKKRFLFSWKGKGKSDKKKHKTENAGKLRLSKSLELLPGIKSSSKSLRTDKSIEDEIVSDEVPKKRKGFFKKKFKNDTHSDMIDSDRSEIDSIVSSIERHDSESTRTFIKEDLTRVSDRTNENNTTSKSKDPVTHTVFIQKNVFVDVKNSDQTEL
ncbi:uncharacterized protein LOC101241235 isoform X1 [Hydra vulgaris]|uniref:Uncharacterized protein LOC101241235 isoform X1 n=1 Tax=Hydra vulgaris TaxID=6087 RepID=A0ABM4BFP3_HYDVU